jgi:hypothetical protein
MTPTWRVSPAPAADGMTAAVSGAGRRRGACVRLWALLHAPALLAGLSGARPTPPSLRTTAGGWPAGGRGDGLRAQAVLGQRVPDPPGLRGSDPAVDRQRLP